MDINDLHMRVRDVYDDGTCNFNLLYTNISTVVKEFLQSIPMCLNPTVTDCFTWKGNLNGIYSTRDGYFWFYRFNFVGNLLDNVSWTWLWHIPAPDKLIFFSLDNFT